MANTSRLKFQNINELSLKSKVSYVGKKPHDIYVRLPTMHTKAQKCKEEGDEETAYILFKRWLESVEWVKSTQEYKNDKSVYLTNMRTNQINEVKTTIADLYQKLTSKYDEKMLKKKVPKCDTGEKMDLEIEPSSRTNCKEPLDISLTLPETPTDDPLNNTSDQFITCDQLFQLSQKTADRYLIIDVRSKQEYQASRISLSRCVNIPASEIRFGVLATHFEKYLVDDKQALELFKRRGVQYVDNTIILDWSTSRDLLTDTNPLSILKKILENWDPNVRHKRIQVLEGGYTEWLVRYPTFATNPNVMVPESKDSTNDILEDIEYPDWLHSDEEDNIKKARQKNYDTQLKDKSISKTKVTNDIKQIYKQSSDTVNSSLSSTLTNRITNYVVDNKSLYQTGNINLQVQNEEAFSSQRKSTAIIQNDVIAKPVVDRSSKPSNLKSQNNDAKSVLKLLKELHNLLKEEENLEQKMLEFEDSLYKQHDMKHEEKHIRIELQSLNSKVEDKKKAIANVEEELNKFQSTQFSTIEENEKGRLDFSIVLVKRRLKNIATDRKKLYEASVKEEQTQITPKHNEGTIHKESLKGDGMGMNTGLERSYSSPNLSQLVDRKAPQVDRSSKPQIIPQNQNGTISNGKIPVSRLNWSNHEERMTPIHGSVHPGITGLKNLGNSCYMNSIIQCLSNTTYLTKYFMDNLYIDDLNASTENSIQCQVVEEVAQVIKALWRGQYKSISPYDLKVAIGKYKSQFLSYDQQDSHEFLTFLLDWMHNELKKKTKTHDNMSVVEKEWDKAMNSQRSIISDLFFGQLRSTITCAFCNEASTTYETFNSLTMSLPHSNKCTLNDCIQKFVSGQKVLGWKCPKCQMPREATKKFDFVKLAPIVVIHLNRFAESGGWLEKRNIAVDFPLTAFNLRPYLIACNDTSRITANVQNYSYNLYAMSNHYGTMEGGHYTAFCKNTTQNRWYKYDDQTVTDVTSNQVKSQTTSAYLLFYTSFTNTFI